jgi:hypothetical protein
VLGSIVDKSVCIEFEDFRDTDSYDFLRTYEDRSLLKVVFPDKEKFFLYFTKKNPCLWLNLQVKADCLSGAEKSSNPYE